MNKDEKIAKNYLTQLYHDEVIFEPKGKRTPDFSIRNIGMEVTRLEQKYDYGTRRVGLYDFQVRLNNMIESLFREFDSSEMSESFWVSVRYKRLPNIKIKQVKKKVKYELEYFLKNYSGLPYEIELEEGIELTIIKNNLKSNRVFDLGTSIDLDAGGWIVSLYIESINCVINEKTKKIFPFKNDYIEWWLLLIDRLSFQPKSNEKKEIINSMDNFGAFKKIIIIDPGGSEVMTIG